MDSGRTVNRGVSLDVIQVAEPCHESWDQMTGDDRMRYCQGCRKHVYNLSAMSRTDAERLVCEAAGSLCVRFARGGDGVVQTLEYRAPTKRPRGWKFWTAVSTAAAALMAGVNVYVFARGRPQPTGAMMVVGMIAPPPPTPRAVMGEVFVPPDAAAGAAPAPADPEAVSGGT